MDAANPKFTLPRMAQTRAMESIAGVDNTPQSLIIFAGNNVHALYDFLLNYRSFYSPLSVW
ncbi:hypothetical protein ACS0TY_015918 [Phlomoides rotata]